MKKLDLFIKTVFEILSGFLHFKTFKFVKSIHCTLRDKTFFSWIGRTGYQKIRLFVGYWFQNVHLTFGKMDPKKVLSKKTDSSIGKSVFWTKLLLGDFYKVQMYIIEICIKRRIFRYPVWPIQRRVNVCRWLQLAQLAKGKKSRP